jgi:hypothetical protein
MSPQEADPLPVFAFIDADAQALALRIVELDPAATGLVARLAETDSVQKDPTVAIHGLRRYLEIFGS